MHEKVVATPGTWKSTINSTHVVNGSPRLADLRMNANALFWLQNVPEEQGRVTIFCEQNGELSNLLPSEFSVGSKVHEYGGGALLATDTHLFFVNAKDQQIYAASLEHRPLQPQPLTQQNDCRFADLSWDPHREELIAICERHQEGREASNTVVIIATKEETAAGEDAKYGIPLTLASGHDFYAAARVSPCGNYLCWVQWSHPDMPWDCTSLCVADRRTKTIIREIGVDTRESIVQPVWGYDAQLFFVSDKTEWWNIYSIDVKNEQSQPEPVFQVKAECATPQWVFAMQNYALISKHELLVSYTRDGLWHADRVNIASQQTTPLIRDTAWIDNVTSSHGCCAFFESHIDAHPSIKKYAQGAFTEIVLQNLSDIERAEISQAKTIRFTTKDQQKGHAFFYPAFNTRFRSEQATPLIVLCHGGPTGQTSAGLNLKIQYWTTRGFAVADINYRGSTGFGKPYRESLKGQWGVYDIDDAQSAVEYLVRQNWVDPEKIIIKGSSAGGFTVLAALAFCECFNAGVSLYGIGDLSLLAQHTHKFEKHYLDSLVGPYPAAQEIYEQRSPIYHIDKIKSALIMFQGLEDKVVPAEQARNMASALRAQNSGRAVSLVEYDNEGHGFRNPDNIRHMLNTEQDFYQSIFFSTNSP